MEGLQNSSAPDVRAPENTAADTGGSRLSPLSPTASHSPGGRRIGSLDAMRGFALCGIAFVNVPALWRLPYEAGRDNSVQEFLNLFVQQRFFPIFSLLFGIGFGLMWTAARTRAARPRVVMLRRFAVLAVLGRMSLTNYIGATLLFWAVKDALPLFGVVDDSTASWSAAMGVVAGILVVQWMFSVAWQTFFRQGPLEWLWRKATWAGAKPA